MTLIDTNDDVILDKGDEAACLVNLGVNDDFIIAAKLADNIQQSARHTILIYTCVNHDRAILEQSNLSLSVYLSYLW